MDHLLTSNMKVRQRLPLSRILSTIFVLGVASAQSISPNQYGSDSVLISKYIGPSVYPGYYIYNYLQIDQSRGIPIGIFADGIRPGVTSFQPTYNYYGIPVYDYRYQFNQLLPAGFPAYQPPSSIPSSGPSVPSTGSSSPPTTDRPTYEDDGIEKLDETLDPKPEDNSPHREDDDDDSVIIDSA